MMFLLAFLGTELFRFEMHLPPLCEVDSRLLEMDEAIGADEWDDD